MSTLVIYRDGHNQRQYSGKLWSLNDAQLVHRGPESAKKICSAPLHRQQQPELLIQVRLNLCFHVYDPGSPVLMNLCEL